MEGDSRNDSTMNQPASTPPARTRLATVTTHINCDLCQELPNIIVHTIGNCPILSQHGLHCPAPSAIQPSPSLNTNIPPPSLPTIETSSILGSIRRQVATMEQTMNNGMEDLADNVSQVMSPNDVSFDASTPSSPMPTGWKTGLSRLYQHKLHSLPFDHHDYLCDKINTMAKNLTTTGEAVSYAIFMIDRRIKYNKDAKVDEAAQLLSINDNVSIKSELESVPENDAIKSVKSLMIIEGIPLTKSRPFMVKTANSVSQSDDASDVLILRDHLQAQQEQQTKVNQAILKSMEDLNGNKIHDKGADKMTKMVLTQTVTSFPPLPMECIDTTMGEWIDTNHSILAAVVWDINGVSIVEMKGVIAANALNHY